MPIPYYPGCTLSTKGRGYDASGRAVAKALGLELEELQDWNCCGATFPLAMDNLLAITGPARVLVAARAQSERIATLCAICYNVLKRTNQATPRRESASIISSKPNTQATYGCNTSWRSCGMNWDLTP